MPMRKRKATTPPNTPRKRVKSGNKRGSNTSIIKKLKARAKSRLSKIKPKKQEVDTHFGASHTKFTKNHKGSKLTAKTMDKMSPI